MHLHPKSAEALNYLAYMWAERGVTLDRALAYSIRSLDIEPENAAYLDTLGWIYYKQGQYELALAQLSKAFSLMAEDPTIADHLGDAYAALGKRESALTAWSKAFLANPENVKLTAKLEAHGADVEALRKQARENRDIKPPDNPSP